MRAICSPNKGERAICLKLRLAAVQTGLLARGCWIEASALVRIRTIIIVCLALILSTGQSAAQAERDSGWPHIRGPHYDGVSAERGLSDSWPASGPAVLWVRELGQGYSSCVAQDNRVYTQYQTLAGQFVLCLDADTGETIWEFRYDWPFEITGQYPGPFSTPTLAENHVYFTTPAGGVGCLTLAGKLVWSRELKQEFDGQGTDFGYACSPTVVDGKVILPVGGRGASLVALDAENGDLVWKSGDEAASYVGVLPIEIGNQTLIIGFLQHCLVGCDLQMGEQQWKQSLSHGYDEHSCWPIYQEPMLWTSAPFQAGAHLWKLSPPSSNTDRNTDEKLITEQWHCEQMSNDVSSSVLVDGTIYGFDLTEAQSKAHRPSRGCFRAIDFETGEVLWSNGNAKTRRETDFESNRSAQIVGHSSVLAADEKLFLLNDLGDLIMLKATPQEYAELGRVRVLGGEISWASLALDRGRLFLRNRSRMVCLYVGDPKSANAPNIETRLQVSDIPQGSVRDFAALIGVEPEYSMDPPTQRWLWNWYFSGASILLAAQLVSWIVGQFGFRDSAVGFSEIVFYCSVFVLGILVGPVLSLRFADFVFTWPSCLFITFTAAVQRCDLRRRSPEAVSRRDTFRSMVIGSSFLLTCGAYFLLCQRLSLVTQWSFLMGFPAAIPCLLLNRHLRSRLPSSKGLPWRRAIASLTLLQLAYAGYFGLVVIVLFMNYEIPPR